MNEIFLSRPNWIPDKFERGIDNFYNILSSIELNPRTIGKSDFPNQSPLDEVIGLMNKCIGTIVLGVPQIEIETARIKGTEIKSPILLGTEWNHIEAALAYSLGHPLLIIHHDQVSRGIFDRGASNSFIYAIDLNQPDWAMSKQISGALSNWKSRLNENHLLKKTTILEKETPTMQWGMYKFAGDTNLYCPVCYQKDGLKIPCSRVNSKIYRCPNCKAELS